MEPIKADSGRAGLLEFNCLVQQSQAHLNLRGPELDKPDSLANSDTAEWKKWLTRSGGISIARLGLTSPLLIHFGWGFQA